MGCEMFVWKTDWKTRRLPAFHLDSVIMVRARNVSGSFDGPWSSSPAEIASMSSPRYFWNATELACSMYSNGFAMLGRCQCKTRNGRAAAGRWVSFGGRHTTGNCPLHSTATIGCNTNHKPTQWQNHKVSCSVTSREAIMTMDWVIAPFREQSAASLLIQGISIAS